ncbi:lactonase family protein [Neolewinella aurantiaca]|uniref:Lactonase family protein n=1 Tax=Neolewinella aurantiaca TaxID=2602767 RepID=A0A5C7FN59_9BACT|nr:lactonase family protein [Neolewinella aurantiaca]TXF91645.1 lactonase family protein [Neolewinella aurantiaca]
MNRNQLYFCLFLLSGFFQTCTPKAVVTEGIINNTAYIGAYTRDEGWVHGKSDGISQITVDPESGRILSKRSIASMVNPSFVLESESGDYLYAISEMARKGEPSGSLVALDINDGYRKLSELPTGGKASCHVEVDGTGKMLMTTNYLGGVAMAFLQKDDGTLVETDKFVVPEGVMPGKQPHLHSSNFSPSNRIVAVADLGLDRVWLFYPNPVTGKITPHAQGHVQLASGAGPRHTEWSADGQFLYVINELNGTVNVLSYNGAEDRFNNIQTISTLPEGFSGKNSCADIHLHPSGNFLYGSNRGHNSIVAYTVDKNSGKLELIGHHSTEGDFPRNFAIAPSGKFLYVANQNTSNITVHSINQKSGKLKSLGQSFDIATPVCIEF